MGIRELSVDGSSHIIFANTYSPNQRKYIAPRRSEKVTHLFYKMLALTNTAIQ
jgi:hypothetical protein